MSGSETDTYFDAYARRVVDDSMPFVPLPPPPIYQPSPPDGDADDTNQYFDVLVYQFTQALRQMNFPPPEGEAEFEPEAESAPHDFSGVPNAFSRDM